MYQTKIINPHAMFFEKVFSRTDVVTDFLQNYLPEKVISQLDLSTIKLEKKTFVSNELKSTQSDLLFRVKTNDDLFLRIYILLEHKSYLDRWVMLQLLGYIVQIFENQRQVNKQKRQEIRDANLKQNQPENAGIKVEYLEPVIPIVIYHGKSDWNVQNDLSSLFNKGIIYQKYIPDFQFELVNTVNFDDDDFRGNVILHVALMAMKHYFMDDLEEKTPELLRLLRDLIINKNSGIVFLEVLLRYLSTNKNYDKEWLKSNIEKVFTEKGENIMNTIADIWIEEGKKEGKKEGILEEARRMLMEALVVKFKNISQSMEKVLNEIKDRNVLSSLLREAILSNNLNEFQLRLDSCREGRI